MVSGLRIATVLLAAASGAFGHSWLDELEVVGGGPNSKLGTKGYIRNWQGKTTGPNPTDDNNIPGYMVDQWFGKPLATNANPELDVPVCNQQFQGKYMDNNNPKFPMLVAAPGDTVMGSYWENGHVSADPFPQGDRPANGKPGLTYWFGTREGDKQHMLKDVRKWGPKGKSRLLAKANFDDGRCTEQNEAHAEAVNRLKTYGSPARCVSTFTLPSDLKDGDTYTVYWVWDYSGHFPNDPNHVEWYSSCMDIKISTSGSSKRALGNSAKFRRFLSIA